MQTTEESIINAALELFSEKGYEATSIRDIAEKSNVKSATLYYYVKTKKDLLLNIMKNYLHQLIEVTEEKIRNSSSPKEKLKQLIRIHVKNHGKEKLAALVVDNEYRSLKGEDRKQVKELRSQYEQFWLEVLEEGKSQGTFHFRDSKITAFALIGLCTYVVHWYREGEKYSLDEVAEQYVDYGLNIVGLVGEGVVK